MSKPKSIRFEHLKYYQLWKDTLYFDLTAFKSPELHFRRRPSHPPPRQNEVCNLFSLEKCLEIGSGRWRVVLLEELVSELQFLCIFDGQKSVIFFLVACKECATSPHFNTDIYRFHACQDTLIRKIVSLDYYFF